MGELIIETKTYPLSKEQLTDLLHKGLSTRGVAEETGYPHWQINYWCIRYGIAGENRYAKPAYDESYFHRIDTREKAYLLGFFLGDGCIGKNGSFSISLALADKCVLDFAAKELGAHVRVYDTIDKAKRKFPKAMMKIGNRSICRDVGMLFGGRTKKERHIPRIRHDLEHYLVQGFFDAEGCITWGRRKDRDRIWQKVNITSQYNMLIAIQNILDKNGISSALRKKSDGDCYVIEICKPERVINAMEYIYQDKDFIVLPRKYEKYQALRLELGEFGESRRGRSRAKPAEQEGVETIGGAAMLLNDRGSAQVHDTRYSPTLAATQAT